jgi:hypothetical protein
VTRIGARTDEVVEFDVQRGQQVAKNRRVGRDVIGNGRPAISAARTFFRLLSSVPVDARTS